jgi:hypothetical protein
MEELREAQGKVVTSKRETVERKIETSVHVRIVRMAFPLITYSLLILLVFFI